MCHAVSTRWRKHGCAHECKGQKHGSEGKTRRAASSTTRCEERAGPKPNTETGELPAEARTSGDRAGIAGAADRSAPRGALGSTLRTHPRRGWRGDREQWMEATEVLKNREPPCPQAKPLCRALTEPNECKLRTRGSTTRPKSALHVNRSLAECQEDSVRPRGCLKPRCAKSDATSGGPAPAPTPSGHELTPFTNPRRKVRRVRKQSGATTNKFAKP